METQCFAYLIADRMQRGERSHRFLKDDRDPTAADRPHLWAVARQFRDIDDLPIVPGVGEQHFSTGYQTAAREYAQDGLADDRFPRPRFTDQGDDGLRANAK